MNSLGYVAHHTGSHDRAIEYYHESLAVARACGDTWQTTRTLDDLGHPHVALGEHEQARTVWQEALELYRDQARDTDADRVQRQLNDLDKRNRTASPHK